MYEDDRGQQGKTNMNMNYHLHKERKGFVTRSIEYEIEPSSELVFLLTLAVFSDSENK